MQIARRKIPAVLTMTMTMSLGAGVLAVPDRPAQAAAYSVQRGIEWGPCPDVDDPQVDCGTLDVPLDHDRPDGPVITLALERRRADDQAGRIGSMFANPGGPGSEGTPFGRFATNVFGPDITRVFDVIGFDPRGVGKSTQVQCFESDEPADALWSQVRLVPLPPDEIQTWIENAETYSEACGEHGGALLRHLSTLNVAKDLDLLRAAVGDEKLTYYGYSYGTMIGATYANLFPERVRALVLDGAVDPAARANRRLGNKLDRAAGFETALTGLLDACQAAGSACAFYGGDLTARQKFDRLREHLRRESVEHDGSLVTISSFTNAVGSALYSRDRFAPLARAAADLYAVVFPATDPMRGPATETAGHIARLAEGAPGTRGRLSDSRPFPTPDRGGAEQGDTNAVGEAYSYNGTDVLFGVNCVDAPLPRNPDRYWGVAWRFEQAHRTFGRAEALSELPCATWPVVTDERYAGPWNHPTSATVLVISTTFDPATPHSMGIAMAEQLGNARLLTLEGYGHTSDDSRCIELARTAYLIDGTLPPAGTMCEQDLPPFPAPQ